MKEKLRLVDAFRFQTRAFRATLAVLAGLMAVSAGAATLDSKDITVTNRTGFNRVRIRLDTPVDVRVVDAVASDGCYFVDIYSAVPAFPDSVFRVQDGILKAYQTRSYPKNNVLRVIFYPAGRAAFQVADEETGTIFPVASLADTTFVPERRKTSSLLIDTFHPRFPNRANRARRLVILDPGHGGSDPGAVFNLGGKRRMQEKDVTLAVAKETQRLLNKSASVEAVLTRESDVRVGLRARRDFAERLQGDLFVSIHTNAAKYHKRRNSARGVEFYFLGRASDPDTSALVEGENSDDGAALDSASSAQLDRIMKQIARDFLEDSRVSGARVCESLQRAFLEDSYFKEYNRGVKSAPFQVLMNRVMPAVLVEIGFIDHPAEVRYLENATFQKRIAKLLADAVLRHFAETNSGANAQRKP